MTTHEYLLRHASIEIDFYRIINFVEIVSFYRYKTKDTIEYDISFLDKSSTRSGTLLVDKNFKLVEMWNKCFIAYQMYLDERFGCEG